MNEIAQAPINPEWAMPDAHGIRGELFVINLCASMTPMPALPKQLQGFEKYRLYQVSRQEDGRRRYRLRLGFFSSEGDAEMAVSAIRNIYPTAFAGCAGSEDQRFLSDITVATATPPTIALKPPTAATVAAPAARIPAPSRAPSSNLDKTARHPTLSIPKDNKPAPAPTAPSTSNRPSTVTASSSPAFASPAAKPATTPLQRIAKTPAAAPKPIVAATIVAPVARPSVELPLGNRAPQIVDDFVPVLDSTLTIRTLTRAEADDPNRAKWFVVQLALSEQAVNLDAMPKLDIFAAYSLYSVALMEGGTIRHALRLGFFREHVSADAVMGYLKTFFAAPTVNQVSTSEYERFAESKPVKAAPPQQKVVSLDNKRETPTRLNTQNGKSTLPPAHPAKPERPTAQRAPVAKPSDIKLGIKLGIKPGIATRQPSFLSRLIGRQLD